MLTQQSLATHVHVTHPRVYSVENIWTESLCHW